MIIVHFYIQKKKKWNGDIDIIAKMYNTITNRDMLQGGYFVADILKKNANKEMIYKQVINAAVEDYNNPLPDIFKYIYYPDQYKFVILEILYPNIKFTYLNIQNDEILVEDYKEHYSGDKNIEYTW